MAQQEYGDQVRFVGVGGRADAEEITGFVSNFNVDGFDHVVDLEGEVWVEYGVTSQPAFAFINDDGTVEVLIGGLGLDGIKDAAEALIAQ